jgi:hypothetical protein
MRPARRARSRITGGGAVGRRGGFRTRDRCAAAARRARPRACAGGRAGGRRS